MLFFELIQVSLGKRDCLSKAPTAKEWTILYDMARRQSLLGICFAGVEKLQTANQVPPMDLLMRWYGLAEQIRQTNHRVDELCVDIQHRLSAANLSSCILKGQGMALLYGSLADLRQSGDIDVWVKGGFGAVNRFVQSTLPTTDIAYHRFHYNIYPDTEVELHHRPTLMRNLRDDRKLQHWCDSFAPESFVVTEKGFTIPPASFNRLFILTHIYRHFLFEGTGLRQLMDYYFVLCSEPMSQVQKEELMQLLRSLKLQRFAAGTMWILSTVFGLEPSCYICEPNEAEGRFILSEIMNTGNFGQAETRYQGYSKLRRMASHSLHLIAHYPSEVLWTPIWLIYHKLWKFSKRRSLR